MIDKNIVILKRDGRVYFLYVTDEAFHRIPDLTWLLKIEEIVPKEEIKNIRLSKLQWEYIHEMLRCELVIDPEDADLRKMLVEIERQIKDES